MKKLLTLLIIFSSLLSASAKVNPILADKARIACQKDINNYCNKVNEGQGRMLACLYGHADQISSHCEYYMFKVANQMKDTFNSISKIADSCLKDISTYCTSTTPGEGRVLDCLADHYDYISKSCYKTIEGMSTPE